MDISKLAQRVPNCNVISTDYKTVNYSSSSPCHQSQENNPASILASIISLISSFTYSILDSLNSPLPLVPKQAEHPSLRESFHRTVTVLSQPRDTTVTRNVTKLLVCHDIS